MYAFHVPTQIPRLSKTVVAEFAFVRFFASMNQMVSLQTCDTGKGSEAYFAFKSFVGGSSCIDPI